jgi:hypothetical protein
VAIDGSPAVAIAPAAAVIINLVFIVLSSQTSKDPSPRAATL